MRHRLDPLIAERAKWLHSDTKWSGPARYVTEKLLGYDETLRVADECANLSAASILAKLGTRLAQNVAVSGLHNIPRHGPALVVANHPTGIADAIILHHCLSQIRPDLFIYANSDVLRVLPQLDDVIIPVEWRKERRSHTKTRVTMQETATAIAQQKLGLIFPSGRIAKRSGMRLEERAWMPSAAMIARKFDIPIIPIHIAARNSLLFYVLDFIHTSLRDITLFHETLNKDRQSFDITIGRPIAPATLSSKSTVAIETIKQATMTLGHHGRRPTPGQSDLPLVGGMDAAQIVETRG